LQARITPIILLPIKRPKHRLLGASPPPARGLRPPRSRFARSPTRHPPARPYEPALNRHAFGVNLSYEDGAKLHPKNWIFLPSAGAFGALRGSRSALARRQYHLQNRARPQFAQDTAEFGWPIALHPRERHRKFHKPARSVYRCLSTDLEVNHVHHPLEYRGFI
jgi:hypothetical protein